MRRPLRVEIVAPVHNRCELTLRCLRSVARLVREGLEVHTIIVDDGSTDGTSRAIRKEFPEVEVVPGDGSLWYTEGTNVGVRAALEHDPDYVLMMNDDQVLNAHSLVRLVETAERHPRSIVGPLLLLWDRPHQVFQVAPKWRSWSGGWRHWHQQTVFTLPKRTWKVELIVGNCVLVPTVAIREAGLMDSRRFPNFGDAEYTPRLRRYGWRLLIEPRAVVFCQPNEAPPRFRHLPWREKLHALLLDLRHSHNIRRRWAATFAGAPSRWQGCLAFFVFHLRVLLGKNLESRWALGQVEAPLSELFEDAVVERVASESLPAEEGRDMLAEGPSG